MKRLLLSSFLAVSSVLILASAWGGGWRGRRASKSDEVLKLMSSQAEVLINVSPVDLPSSTEMIRLGHKATPAIINGLVNNMSEDVREMCASVLVATRDPAALQALVDALDEPSRQVRGRAIKALGQVESRAATPKLLEIIGRQRVSGSLRNGAIRALGRTGDPRAVRPLRAYYEENQSYVALEALWNLRRHLKSRHLEAIVLAPLKSDDADSDVRRFAIERAGDLKLKAAVPLIIKRFDDNYRLQNRMVYNLGRMGSRKAVSFLENLLESAERRLLNNVVFALDRLGWDTRPFLRKALKDRRAYIRFNAAFVVGDLGQKDLVAELAEGLKDPNDYVRSEVAVALGRLGSAAAVEALEAASREKNPVVRRDALLALARIDYAAYRQRILDELVTSDISSVSAKAVSFLASREDPANITPVLARLDPDGYRQRAMGVAFLDRFWTLDSMEATAWLLRVANTGSSHDALRLLGRFKDQRIQPILRQWLTQPGGEQAQLLRAMGRFGDREALPMAREWLKRDDAPESQLYAAFALIHLGEAEGTDKLVEGLEHGPVYLKRVAATLLTEIDLTKAADLKARLEGLLEHRDVYVRLYAARGLVESGHEGALALLFAELQKRVPFIRDEVLDIVERAPERVREPAIDGWLKGDVDSHLARELERIR